MVSREQEITTLLVQDNLWVASSVYSGCLCNRLLNDVTKYLLGISFVLATQNRSSFAHWILTDTGVHLYSQMMGRRKRFYRVFNSAYML